MWLPPLVAAWARQLGLDASAAKKSAQAAAKGTPWLAPLALTPADKSELASLLKGVLSSVARGACARCEMLMSEGRGGGAIREAEWDRDCRSALGHVCAGSAGLAAAGNAILEVPEAIQASFITFAAAGKPPPPAADDAIVSTENAAWKPPAGAERAGSKVAAGVRVALSGIVAAASARAAAASSTIATVQSMSTS